MRLAKGQSLNRVVDHLDHLFLGNLPSRLRLFLRTILVSRMSSLPSRMFLLRNKPSPPNAMKICLPFSPPLPPAFLLCKRNYPLLPDCLGCSLVPSSLSFGFCLGILLLSFAMKYPFAYALSAFLATVMLFLLFNDAKRGKNSVTY